MRDDPGRGLSKDPEFLRGTYDRFRTLRHDIARCDLVFDSDSARPEDIALVIRDHVLG